MGKYKHYPTRKIIFDWVADIAHPVFNNNSTNKGTISNKIAKLGPIHFTLETWNSAET